MMFQKLAQDTVRISDKAARFSGRVALRVIRSAAAEAIPQVPIPPAGKPIDLLGRGVTHVLDMPGPTPDAPVLMLMHGIATTGALTWFSVLDELSQHYRVVSFDQRWHGRGIRSEKFSLNDCADDAAAVLDALGIEKAFVAGYSMGGANAQVMWRRHPERVAGLILCSTASHWEGHLGERVFFRSLRVLNIGLLSIAANKVAHQGEKVIPADEVAMDGLRQWLLSELRTTSPWSIPVVMGELSRFDSTKWIGTVDVPTGVLVTGKDHTIPTDRQRSLGAAIPGTIVRESPGGHTSLIFDVKNWKPLFLDLVDDVVAQAYDEAA